MRRGEEKSRSKQRLTGRSSGGLQPAGDVGRETKADAHVDQSQRLTVRADLNEIFRFNVAMHDAKLMHVVERLDHLRPEGVHRPRRHRPAREHVFDERIAQRLAALHDDDALPIVVIVVDHSDDVGIERLKVQEHLQLFPVRLPAGFGVGFDRVRAVEEVDDLNGH